MYFPLMRMPSTANGNGRVASLKLGRPRNRESTQLRDTIVYYKRRDLRVGSKEWGL